MFFNLFGKKNKPVSEMTDREVLDKIRPIFTSILCVEDSEVTMFSHLYDDLGCDELDFLEIMLALDKELDYSVDPAVDKGIKTVIDLIHAIKRYN